jgi:transcriptional regulator of acetoin/glycerol metabolism
MTICDELPAKGRARATVLGRLLYDGNTEALTLVSTALQEAQGCVAKAARQLGVGSRTLWRWIGTVNGLNAVLRGCKSTAELAPDES